jgi:hypothetical protein
MLTFCGAAAHIRPSRPIFEVSRSHTIRQAQHSKCNFLHQFKCIFDEAANSLNGIAYNGRNLMRNCL